MDSTGLLLLLLALALASAAEGAATRPPRGYDDTARCLLSCQEHWRVCADRCLPPEMPTNLTIHEGGGALSPRLPRRVCRGEDVLRVAWEPPPPPAAAPDLYLVQAADQQGRRAGLHWTRHRNATLDALSAGSGYVVSVRPLWLRPSAAHVDGAPDPAVAVFRDATLPARHKVSGVVAVHTRVLPRPGGSVDAVVSWLPGEDATCFSDIWHTTPDDIRVHHVHEPLYLLEEQRGGGSWLSYLLVNLSFGTNYELQVIPRDRNEKREGPSRSAVLTVPPCSDIFPDNAQLCGDSVTATPEVPLLGDPLFAVLSAYNGDYRPTSAVCEWNQHVAVIFSCYCGTVRKLRRLVQNQKHGMRTAGVVLPSDSARPHTTRSTPAVLQKPAEELFDHPAHNPDLASSDFLISLHLKKFLSSGPSFDNDK